MAIYRTLVLVLLIFSYSYLTRAQTTSGSTSGTTAGTTTGSTTGGTTTGTGPADQPSNQVVRNDNGGNGAGTPSRVVTGENDLKNMTIGNAKVGHIIALSPIILHLIVLIWVWASKLTVKEILADKETVRQNNATALRLQQTKMQSLFPRSTLTLGPVLPDAATLQTMIQTDANLRAKFLDYTASQPARAALLAEENDPVTPPQVGSISRLILFIAGHAGVALGTCLTSFVIFFRLNSNGDTPELTGLIGVILALGIGVVPYAVNRFTADKEEAPPQPNR